APHTAFATAATTWPVTGLLILLAAAVAFLLYGKTGRQGRAGFLDDAVAEQENEKSLSKKVEPQKKPDYKFY
ncbi:MAG: hypothetical protein AB1626_03925, partial [Candidatus Micrarchaeota archaeon]